MAFNIKDFVSGLAVKFKSTTDGSNGEVTHHHVDSSALPIGAATAAKQDTALTALASIDARLATGIDVDVQFPATQPVSGPLTNTELRAAAVPVSISGVATDAKQDTANAALGAPADAEATGNGTIVAVLKRIRTLLGNIGAGVAAGSLRVTVATDDTLHTKIGEVQASPTANTVLARLRDIVTSVLSVTPQMASGGNLSAQTANPGTTYTAFGSQACKQLTIVNDTGTTILVQQGALGVGVPIFDQSAFTFFGLTNANALGVKRKDDGNTQVTVAARWEA